VRPRSPIATLYHQNTPATRYWRIDLPAKYLPGKVLPAHELTVRHYVKTDKLTFPQLRGNTAIVQFPGDNGSALLAMAMQARDKRLLVEVDDNYIDYGDELWRKRADWGQKIGDSAHTVKGHCWIVEHAARRDRHDAGTGRGVLAAERQRVRLPQQHRPGRLARARPSATTSSASAGTPATRTTATRRHDRERVVVGVASARTSRSEHRPRPRLELQAPQVEWTNDFRRQRKWLGALDVGVAPIVSTPLSKYRSDLKALEYAMGGAMPFLQSEPRSYWDVGGQGVRAHLSQRRRLGERNQMGGAKSGRGAGAGATGTGVRAA
jgi:hypothetical protein